MKIPSNLDVKFTSVLIHVVALALIRALAILRAQVHSRKNLYLNNKSSSPVLRALQRRTNNFGSNQILIAL